VVGKKGKYENVTLEGFSKTLHNWQVCGHGLEKHLILLIIIHFLSGEKTMQLLFSKRNDYHDQK